MAFSCSLQTALQRTQHSQSSAGEVIRRQWVAVYIILFATVPSESAFHNRGLKTGADSGFLLLQPDIVNKTKIWPSWKWSKWADLSQLFQKCISGELLVLHHALLLLRDTVVIGTSKGTISFSCTLREETWNSIKYQVFIKAWDTSAHYTRRSSLSRFIFWTLSMICFSFRHLLERGRG